MKGKHNNELSWEKQTIFDLDNGTSLTIEWNYTYGEFVKRIDDKDGHWCASNGLKTLPERFVFVREWVDKHGFIRPKFEKVFDS